MGKGKDKGGICMADGGITRQETPDELMARMTAKYGAPSAGPSQASPASQATPANPAPQPAQPAPPKPASTGIGGVMGILRSRKEALEKAANFADGGIPEDPLNKVNPARVRIGGAGVDSTRWVSNGAGGPAAGPGMTPSAAPSVEAAYQRPDFNTPDQQAARAAKARAINPTASATAPPSPAPSSAPAAAPAAAPTTPEPAGKAFKAGQLASKGANLLGGIVKAGGTMSPLAGFGDYHINDDIDSSAAGTAKYLANGEGGKAWESVKKGAVEAGLDSVSGVAKTIDAATGLFGFKPNLSQQLADKVRTDLGGVASTPADQTANLPQPDMQAATGGQSSIKVDPFGPKPDQFAIDVNSDGAFMTGKDGARPDSSGGGFVQKNVSYNVNPTNQEGITKITSTSTNPLFTNIRPEDAVAGLKDQAVGAQGVQEGLNRHARANAITQSIIDAQPAGGVGIMGDGGVEADNAEKTARWRQDELLQAAKYGNRAADEAIRANANIAAEGMRGAVTQRGQDITRGVTLRGQDMTANIEASRLAGNPLDNRIKQNQITAGQMANAAVEQMANLHAAYGAETDPAKRSDLAERIRVLSGKEPNYSNRYIALPNRKTYNEMGQVTGEDPGGVFDAQSGRPVNIGPQANNAVKPTPEQIAMMRANKDNKAYRAAADQMFGQGSFDAATKGYAEGGIIGGIKRFRFEGEGGPREDKIPVKVAGDNINVSAGEQALILPAKTADNQQAIEAIGKIIADSNDGRQPAMGSALGSKFANGGLIGGCRRRAA